MRTSPMAAIYGHRGARAERPEKPWKHFYTRPLEARRHRDRHRPDRGCLPGAASRPGTPRWPPDQGCRQGGPSPLGAHTSRPRSPTSPTLNGCWKSRHSRIAERTHPPELIAAQVIEVLGKLPTTRNVAILAFDWAVLRAIAVRNPGLRRVCLTAPKTAQRRTFWWGPGFEGTSIPQAVAATGTQAGRQSRNA